MTGACASKSSAPHSRPRARHPSDVPGLDPRSYAIGRAAGRREAMSDDQQPSGDGAPETPAAPETPPEPPATPPAAVPATSAPSADAPLTLAEIERAIDARLDRLGATIARLTHSEPTPSSSQGAGETAPAPAPRKDPRSWIQRAWFGPKRW